jgi:hypothetical protein
MFDSSWWMFAVMCIIGSPLLLQWVKDGAPDVRSFLISLCAVSVVFAAPYLGFGDQAVVWKFLLAQTLLFMSFVCVSRIRQRKSLFLMALASVGSNGGWFLAMQILAGAYLASKQGIVDAQSIGVLMAAIAGTLVGRLVGVQWMTWVEKRFQVRTDSVGTPTLKWLDAHTQPALRVIFFGTLAVYGVLHFVTGVVSIVDVVVVMTLGFVQSNVYTINTRFANRDHPGWPVLTGLLGGVVFMVHWTYLIGYTQSGGFMPLVLMIPYTVATVYGANSGAVLSMMLEKMLGIEVDTHKKSAAKDAFKQVTWHKPVLIGIALVCGVYLVTSGYVLAMIGATAHTISLPFTLFAGTQWERPAALFMGGLVFFLNNITHTLSSRAGNRDHAPYHAVTCVVHGVVTFATGTFVVLNAHFLDLVPVAAFGSAAGQLFAQKWSMGMEKWLSSVMDVPQEKKAVPKPA